MEMDDINTVRIVVFIVQVCCGLYAALYESTKVGSTFQGSSSEG